MTLGPDPGVASADVGGGGAFSEEGDGQSWGLAVCGAPGEKVENATQMCTLIDGAHGGATY